MDEDVFLVFVGIAVAAIGLALIPVRQQEENNEWTRFRFSSFVWIVLTAMITAGFINMSDSWLVVAGWLLVSGFFIFQACTRLEGSTALKCFWAFLILLPG